jgi:hypothetical protein
MQDRDAGAGLRGHVGELERDEAAPDEDDPRRQRVEIEELVAGRDVLGARKPERLRDRAGRDQDAAGDETVVADVDRRRPHEPGASVEGRDARLRVALLGGGRRRIRRRALGAHEGRPVDRDAVRADAPLAEGAGGVDGLRRRDQDLLGDASAQRAGAAERAGVDDRHRPPGVAAA